MRGVLCDAGLQPVSEQTHGLDARAHGESLMFNARPESVAPLVENFFRREAGRLVAVLTRFFGWRNFDLVEEMVQAALLEALQSWRVRGVPANPSAWVHRVAKNKVLDALRRNDIGRRAIEDWAVIRPAPGAGIDDLFLDTAIEDSQLRMIFACCHPLLRAKTRSPSRSRPCADSECPKLPARS